jgi:hypothetical protein
VAVACALVSADISRAADTKPPKLVKALMVDADANGRADSLVLTYSEPVNHTADLDGTYPFSVSGYTITSVAGAAASKTLSISLVEKASADLSAKPTVKYTAGVANVVTDVAGNESRSTTFNWTFPVLAIYAAPSGNDANPGTQGAPKHTVAAAISAAAAQSAHDVFLAEGSYPEGSGIVPVAGLTITGGFAASTWARHGTSTISGTPQAVLLSGVTGVSLRYLTLVGGASGASSYGVFATGSTFALEQVTISAAKGADGANGSTPAGTAAPGGNGQPGQPGAENSSLFCSSSSQPQGGAGGTTPGFPTAAGGRGGLPGLAGNSGSAGAASTLGTPGGPGTPSGQGNWNPPPQYVGGKGSDGAAGSNASAGASGYSISGYAPTNGGDGSTGAVGAGGGGGGGGGGGVVDCDSYGGGGGGGGAGGAPGAGGSGGQSGTGSFAVFLWASKATITGAKITTTGGGAGGNGAAGQPGAAGGVGGGIGDPATSNVGNPYGGSSEQDDGSNGARGGAGGKGGDGGAGGGGAGGPSVGVLIGGGSTATIKKTTYTLGAGGAGGSSPGNPGAGGPAVATLTP